MLTVWIVVALLVAAIVTLRYLLIRYDENCWEPFEVSRARVRPVTDHIVEVEPDIGDGPCFLAARPVALSVLPSGDASVFGSCRRDRHGVILSAVVDEVVAVAHER